MTAELPRTQTDVAPETPSTTSPGTRAPWSPSTARPRVTGRSPRAVALAAEDATLTLLTTVLVPHWSFLALGYAAASAPCAPREQAAAPLSRAAARDPRCIAHHRREVPT